MVKAINNFVLGGVYLLFTPFILVPSAYAQLDAVSGTLDDVAGLVGTTTGIVVSLAFLAFFWFLVIFIWGAKSPESKSASKTGMIWAVAAIAVLVSIWGLVAFLQNITGVDDATTGTGNIGIPGVDIRN